MGRLSGLSRVYQCANVLGAAGFTINGGWHGAIPTPSPNVVWMLIGAIALCRIAMGRRSAAEGAERGPA